MTSPSTCEALVVRLLPDGKTPRLVKESVSIPEPGPGQVLVRVSHAAQNPTDVKALASNAYGAGAVLGCDFVGTVERLGPSSSSRLKVGDVVAGFIRGGEAKGVGAFSQYTLADERICFVLPEDQFPENVAAVPLAACSGHEEVPRYLKSLT